VLLLVAALVAGLAIALVLLGRFDEDATDRDWSALDRGEGRHAYRWIRAMIPAEAKARLQADREQLLAAAEERLALVRALDAYSRMLDAVRPAPAGAFRLFRLRWGLRRLRRKLFDAGPRAGEAALRRARAELARLDAEVLESSGVLAADATLRPR
jgi:hypothetical protein